MTSRAPALAGKRVLVLRARHQSRDLADRLREAGATPIEAAAIAMVPPTTCEPMDQALRRIATYDWIVFTSANAVRAVASRPGWGTSRSRRLPVRIAAVGPATARAASAAFGAVEFVPEAYHAEAAARELPVAPGMRVLLPAGDRARPALAEGLAARGVVVDRVTAYRTIADPELGNILRSIPADSLDALLFTSPSTLEAFLAQMPLAAELGGRASHEGRPAVICIGPVTAESARRAGLPVHAVAGECTAEGLITTLNQWFAHDR
jgi:uroporphyrinogen-III synthase